MVCVAIIAVPVIYVFALKALWDLLESGRGTGDINKDYDIEDELAYYGDAIVNRKSYPTGRKIMTRRK